MEGIERLEELLTRLLGKVREVSSCARGKREVRTYRVSFEALEKIYGVVSDVGQRVEETESEG